MAEEKKTKIFVACPIGSDDSPERQRSDKLLKFIIYPVVKELLGEDPEQLVVRADKMGEPGRITVQVLRELTSADIVIGDVTGTNANVMYEIGIRQAIMRPFLLMAEKGQHLPFDLNDLRTIFYTLDLDHFELAQIELKSHLEKALSGDISPIDKALFTTYSSLEDNGQSSQSNQSLLAVLEVCESILSETQHSKELIYNIGHIALELKEAKEAEQKAQEEKLQQEMGMWLMSQFLQNPDGVEKVVPALQALANFGKEQIEDTPVRPSQNRASRRRQQKKD